MTGQNDILLNTTGIGRDRYFTFKIRSLQYILTMHVNEFNSLNHENEDPPDRTFQFVKIK